MNKSICFIANFSKTYLFHAIAQVLKKDKVKINWVCTNTKLFEFLKAHYPLAHILYLNRETVNAEAGTLQDFKLNEIIYGDRVLRNEPIFGQQFLTTIQMPIYDFIKRQAIQCFFGEITWAHEVLIHRMCSQLKALQCVFLNPHVVRIPSNRFAFFEDEQQSKILAINPNVEKTEAMLKVKTPIYVKFNKALKQKRNSLNGRLDKIKRFVTNENMDRKDPTLIVNEKTRFVTRFKEEYRKEAYKFIQKDTVAVIGNSPYIYVGLHKQPEASVDVFGRYYDDQLQNIVNLWRILPTDWKLVIKEHPMAIGFRPISFYKSLKKLPNLILLGEEVSSHHLIKKANLVVSITGTIAYEAALMGIPSATFAPTFFNQLHLCRQIDLNSFQSMTCLEAWIQEVKASQDNRLAFSNFLRTHSFPGSLLDPITDKTVLAEENILLLAQGFRKALNSKKISITAAKSLTQLTIAA